MQADALELDEYGEYDVFFFFNPFSKEVFEKVINQILENRKKDGPLTFIYHNPLYLEVLENRLKQISAESEWYQKTVLYDKEKTITLVS